MCRKITKQKIINNIEVEKTNKNGKQEKNPIHLVLIDVFNFLRFSLESIHVFFPNLLPFVRFLRLVKTFLSK
jgi:hypothetical protein